MDTRARAALAGRLAVSLAVAGLSLRPAAFQAPPPAAVRPSELSAGMLLARYAGGDLSAAAVLANHPSKARVIPRFAGEARAWIDPGRIGAPARTLEASVFVLDVARHWVGREDWRYGRQLLAWACDQLRAPGSAPLPAERLWHLAAVALAQGADDWPLLAGRSAESGRPVPSSRDALQNEMGQGHLAHAQGRFPNEPRFKLAWMVAGENRTWEAGGFGRDVNFRGGLSVGEIDDAYLQRLRAGDVLASDGTPSVMPNGARIAHFYLARVADVHQLRQRYEPLANDPALAAEVNVRLSLLAFRMADRDNALRHLTASQAVARDPGIIYLAHLFTGVIRERQGLPDEAIDAYRAALNVVPRAQSATTLLVTRLIIAGRQAEAALLADAFFASGDPPEDPWRLYRLGDFRFFPAYMTALRSAAR